MTDGPRRLGWAPIFRALFGPAFLGPMALWASNAGRFVDVAVVIAAGCGVLAIGTLLTRFARPRHSGHLVGAQLAVLVFWSWKLVPFVWVGNVAGDLIAALVAILAVVLLGSRLHTFGTLSKVLGTAIGVAAISMGVTGWLGDRAAVRVADSPAPSAMIGNSPGSDILFFVFDGYASPLVLDRDFGFQMPHTVDVLEASGFRVQDSAWSNYSFTIDSVPSLLQLQYLALRQDDLLVGPDPGVSRSLVAGNEGLISWLGEIGYHTTKFESGWEDDRCGRVDTCIRASRVAGLTSWILWQRTPLRAVAGDLLLHPYPAAALSIMDKLPAVIAEAASNDRPDFILVHVVLPHPPYALSSTCDPKTALNRDTSDLAEAGTNSIAGQERNGYVNQVMCANSYLEAIAPIVGSSEMTVLVTGDHGSSVRGQVSKQPMSWSAEELTERFGIFLATRTASGCVVGSHSLINVSREVVGCALDIEIPPLEDHHYASIPDREGLVDVTGQLEAAKR